MRQALLSANLAVPPAPAYAVRRPRLMNRLDEAAAKALTIVEAPAGCGKTTMLGDWAETGPVIWLTAESAAAASFWHYVAAALGAAADPGADPLPMLIHHVGRAAAPVTLIVDDAHTLDGTEAFDRLDYLLRHASGKLRLILATRTEPAMALHRWRVRDELTTIGAAELAFTEDETAQVLSRMGVGLSGPDRRDLQRRTEGWPAGVCLCALAVKDRTADDRRLNGFLLAEILGGQPANIRGTLLDASILTRVHGELLDALSGGDDGHRCLSELARRGVLISPIEGSQWYRVHPLLGAAMREELRRIQPDRLPALHTRAATWLADRDLAADALGHALATPDSALATRIVADHWPRLLPSGHRRELPDPPPARRTEGLLSLAYAAERLDRLDSDGAQPYLRLAGPDWPADAFRLAQAQLRGDVAELARTAGRITAQRPHDDAAMAMALTALGTAALVAEDLSTAEPAFREGYARAVAAGLPCPAILCQSRLAYAVALRGDLTAAEQAAYATLDRPACPESAQPVHTAHAYLALGVVAVEQDRLDEAASVVDRAAELFDPATDPALAPTVALLRARLCVELGRWSDAQQALVSARRYGVLDQQLVVAEAGLLTARGDPTGARALLDGVTGPAAAVAYAQACLRDHRAVAADETSEMPTALRVRARVAASRAAWQRGERAQAAAELERALALAEPHGFRRAFTGVGAPERELLFAHLESGTAHAVFLAGLLESGSPVPVRGLLEPLTDRELTVLRYLQSILSNVEVAGAMCLSVNTVKTHVRNIYRKLGARHRRDAIRRARELQLL